MIWRLARRTIDLSRTRVMGIVNVTPDSFSDGGRFIDPERAVEHGLRLVEEGADILDVGGESTRPGAPPVGAEEECARVIPVIERLAGRVAVPISIDTMKASVAARALAAGAEIVNDISALGDPAMAGVAAGAGAGVVLMHMPGTPQTMMGLAQYGDVVAEVKAYLEARLEAAVAAGTEAERIMLDPGIGFGKNLEQNVEIFRRMGELTALARPLLVGHSRKVFIGRLLGDAPPGARLEGTIAAAVVAVLAGVRVLRVHDVGAVARALKVAAALMPAPKGC